MTTAKNHDVYEVLNRWQEGLSALKLRTEPDRRDPSCVHVRVGERGYQGVELRLVPERRYGARETGQSHHAFADGAVAFMTPWDDDGPDYEPTEQSYEDWVEASLAKVVACHLAWEVEGISEASSPGDALKALTRQFQQVERFGLDRFDFSDEVNQASLMMRWLGPALDAPDAAADHLIEATSQSKGGLDAPSSARCLLVYAASAWLADEQLTRFVEHIRPLLMAETRRVCGEGEGASRRFQSFRVLVDKSPREVSSVLEACLEELMASERPESKEDKALRLKIVRYNELSRDFMTYRPASATPLEDAAELLRLEGEINAAWRDRLKPLSGLARSEIEGQLCRDGRFLSRGSGLALGWLRDQGRYNEVVAHFSAQVADAELVKLRHKSQTSSFEFLVNNAFGGYLDSGKQAHITEAVQCLDALETTVRWETRQPLYQIACVLARAGLTDRALSAVQDAVEHGESIHAMARDSDFNNVVDAPRFQALLSAL